MAAAKDIKPAEAVETKEPRVRVFIPLLPEDEGGIKQDQTEVVVINGKNTVIQRGEFVDVSPEIYLQLRNKFAYL